MTALDDYRLGGLVGDFTSNDVDFLSCPEREFIGPQYGADFTASWKQAVYSPSGQLELHWDYSHGDYQADESPTAERHSCPLAAPGQKRKAQPNKRPASKNAKHSFVREKHDDSSKIGLRTHANGIGEEDGEEKGEDRQKVNCKPIRERNRIAANKFRSKKRESLVKLQSNQQDMETRHEMLAVCVGGLNEEILQLKMQLLQHRHCNCSLIQNYIQTEAQRYIEARESEANKH